MVTGHYGPIRGPADVHLRPNRTVPRLRAALMHTRRLTFAHRDVRWDAPQTALHPAHRLPDRPRRDVGPGASGLRCDHGWEDIALKL